MSQRDDIGRKPWWQVIAADEFSAEEFSMLLTEQLVHGTSSARQLPRLAGNDEQTKELNKKLIAYELELPKGD